MSLQANLRMKAGIDCWDRLSLTIKDGNIHYLYVIKDRYTCLELYRQLAIYDYEGVKGEVAVIIDGQEHRWCEEVWGAVYGAIDQWFIEYMYLVELEESDQ